MTRYERVIEILDNAVGGPGENIGVHGAFWRGRTRDEFVAQPPVIGLPVLVVGDGAGSNLVKALKGEAPFDDSRFPRMPLGFPPVPDSEIAFIGFSEAPTEEEGMRRLADEQRVRGFFEESGDSEHVNCAEVPIRVPEGARSLAVRIWDHAGIFVRMLLEVENPAPGRRTLPWNGADCCGRPCPDGQFIWRVTIDDRSESQVMCFRRSHPIQQPS